MPVDAVTCFKAAVDIVVSVIGQNVKDGKIVLNPAIVKYLKQKGIYTESEEKTQ